MDDHAFGLGRFTGCTDLPSANGLISNFSGIYPYSTDFESRVLLFVQAVIIVSRRFDSEKAGRVLVPKWAI